MGALEVSKRVQMENGAWAKRNFWDSEFQGIAAEIVEELGSLRGESYLAEEVREITRQILHKRLGHLLPFIGMVEEMGELAHALLKKQQGIRIDEDHDAAAKDAYADLRIYGFDFCNRMDWDDEVVVVEVWDGVVKKRDWIADPEAGTEVPRHVCGLQGFGAPGDVCPACRAFHKSREKG